MVSTGKSTRTKNLAPYQRLAIDTIRQRALRMKPGVHDDISAVLERAGLSQKVYDDAVESVQARPRVALHFHPERLSRSGESVADGLLQDGVYKNQFDAGLSSGSPSAFPGGERDLWENRLFGSAYHGIDAARSGRPKYGALEIMNHPDGPAPRFGSCYFLHRPGVARRSTFTFGGSHEDCAPECTGTLEVLEPVMAPLLAQIEQGGGAFGVDDLTVAGSLAQMARKFSPDLPIRGTCPWAGSSTASSRFRFTATSAWRKMSSVSSAIRLFRTILSAKFSRRLPPDTEFDFPGIRGSRFPSAGSRMFFEVIRSVLWRSALQDKAYWMRRTSERQRIRSNSNRKPGRTGRRTGGPHPVQATVARARPERRPGSGHPGDA
jgi:Protein of unknown function (DUF3626)